MSYWEDLTRSVTDPQGQVMFLACEAEQVLGSAYALLEREDARAGRVGGMWVQPQSRRQGVARALLAQVLCWARKRRLASLCLWAPANRGAAIDLYCQAGFSETGRAECLPSRPALRVVEMCLSP